MRGTSPNALGVTWSTGIIPAGAGHLAGSLARSAVWGDHPRRCGALNLAYSKRSRAEGSSPQVRGTFLETRNFDTLAGIIPAGAGHLSPPDHPGVRRGDHPRRCGALYGVFGSVGGAAGSSPQVRGTYRVGSVFCRCDRIIPAGAGHLSPASMGSMISRDHPRRCGALGCLGHYERGRVGSSPQVRGTSYPLRLPAKCIRIIPAGAGHFIHLDNKIRYSWDHPRRCGAL